MISMPHPHQNVYLPNADEIRQRCSEIQASWSPAEKERRRVGSAKPKFSPRIVTCHLSVDEIELVA